jgi:hypothetical protein
MHAFAARFDAACTKANEVGEGRRLTAGAPVRTERQPDGGVIIGVAAKL